MSQGMAESLRVLYLGRGGATAESLVELGATPGRGTPEHAAAVVGFWEDHQICPYQTVLPGLT